MVLFDLLMWVCLLFCALVFILSIAGAIYLTCGCVYCIIEFIKRLREK